MVRWCSARVVERILGNISPAAMGLEHVETQFPNQGNTISLNSHCESTFFQLGRVGFERSRFSEINLRHDLRFFKRKGLVSHDGLWTALMRFRYTKDWLREAWFKPLDAPRLFKDRPATFVSHQLIWYDLIITRKAQSSQARSDDPMKTWVCYPHT